MNRSSSLEVPVELDNGKEIIATITADIGNSSIGHYEFHGQKCYDRGNLTVTDYQIEYDSEGLTPEEKFEVDFALKCDKDNLEFELIENLQENEKNIFNRRGI